jgi:hypothetical protein
VPADDERACRVFSNLNRNPAADRRCYHHACVYGVRSCVRSAGAQDRQPFSCRRRVAVRRLCGLSVVLAVVWLRTYLHGKGSRPSGQSNTPRMMTWAAHHPHEASSGPAEFHQRTWAASAALLLQETLSLRFAALDARAEGRRRRSHTSPKIPQGGCVPILSVQPWNSRGPKD